MSKHTLQSPLPDYEAPNNQQRQPQFGEPGYGMPAHGEQSAFYMYQSALPPKDTAIAYLLMIPSLFAICGLQHFYIGKIGRGILWLLTGGLFGIGTIVDLFTLRSQVKTINARRAVGIS